MSKRGPGRNKARCFDGLRFHELVAAPASLPCVRVTARRLCHDCVGLRNAIIADANATRKTQAQVGVSCRPWAQRCCMLRLETARVHGWVRARLRACVFSVSICANQAKTNVLLHSRLAFKILRLVPLVWLWEPPNPPRSPILPSKQPRNSVCHSSGRRVGAEGTWGSGWDLQLTSCLNL